MQLLYRETHLLGERRACLDDHHHLFAALDHALPPVERNHAGQNVYAASKLALDQGSAGLFRLDSGRVGRIDEDDALHAPPTSSMPANAASHIGPAPMTRYERIGFV